MRRRLTKVAALVLVVLFALAARSVYLGRKAAENRAAIEASLRHFSQLVPLGATRSQVKNLLHAEGVTFIQRCCYESNAAYSIIVKVGERPSPWFCGASLDYIAFEFSTREPPRDIIQILDSDVLKLIQLTSNGEGCL